jgi:DNA-binding transcriptional ArsR family regulator
MKMATLVAPFSVSDQPTDVELVSKYFRALADPIRLRILELIAASELCVGEIVECTGLEQSHVSHHLACLRWCGFAATRREHRTVYYRVADQRVLAMIELARALLADNAEHVAACRRIDDGGF